MNKNYPRATWEPTEHDGVQVAPITVSMIDSGAPYWASKYVAGYAVRFSLDVKNTAATNRARANDPSSTQYVTKGVTRIPKKIHATRALAIAAALSKRAEMAEKLATKPDDAFESDARNEAAIGKPVHIREADAAYRVWLSDQTEENLRKWAEKRRKLPGLYLSTSPPRHDT